MHRLAGVLLVLSLPFLIYLLGLSLQNQQSYTTAIKIIQNPLVSFYLYSLLWAISHHFAAGIRYFLVDLDIFISKRSARVSAYVVIVIGILIPVLVFMGRLL
jgi:succinate dehydrogenase / fumarate reductase cytochrome b subunit